MIPTLPQFRFIRCICPDLSDKELRAADAAFMAYAALVCQICEREAEKDSRTPN